MANIVSTFKLTRCHIPSKKKEDGRFSYKVSGGVLKIATEPLALVNKRVRR